MSDLVERLRNPPFADRINTVSLNNEAADRIETLEGALRDLLEAVDAAASVKRGDFYHERKAARSALSPLEDDDV